MNSSPTLRPSAGAWLVGWTYLSVILFFVFGLFQPRLERAWELSRQLTAGSLTRLAPEDFELLQSVLSDHPELASLWLNEKPQGLLSENLEGWLGSSTVYWVRTDRSLQPTLKLEVQSAQELLPLNLRLEGPQGELKQRIDQPGLVEVPLPKVAQPIELWEIRLGPKKASLDPSELSVRLVEFVSP